MGYSALEREVDRNYEAFLREQAALLRDHSDEWVLISSERMVSFHSDLSTALAAGRAGFGDGPFSVQQVKNEPVDLGFYSHAIDSRIA